MSSISSIGKFIITISEPHLNPQKLMQQWEYEDIFRMSNKSSETEKVTYQIKTGDDRIL